MITSLIYDEEGASAVEYMTIVLGLALMSLVVSFAFLLFVAALKVASDL